MTNAADVQTNNALTSYEVIRRKLIDAEIPGAVVEFDPDEADRAGAFVEDALSEADARAAEDGEQQAATARSAELFAAARTAR